MPTSTVLRRARFAVIGLFFLTGLALAMWVVNIPAVQARTGVSHSVLGGLLLVLGAGSVIGMQGAGPLIDRLGSKRMTVLGAALIAVGVNLPGVAQDAWGVGVALFVLGLGNGVMDVAMNDQAVVVERCWGRPIMSSFHAFFSVGGAVGAGVGALVQANGLSVHWSLGFGAVVAVILAAVCIPLLLPSAPVSPAGSEAPVPSTVVPAKVVRGRIAALALLAFLLMLAEGTANDWSALQAVERLGVPEAAGSIAYGAFAVAMTIGRFAADPVSHRFGPVAIVRYGSVLAAIGMALVVFSGVYPLTLVGWVVFGLGLSGIVPQIFTAAGNLGVQNQGVVISRVVGAGYVGLLAGPAVIGWLSHLTGLSHALILPLVFCAVGVVLATQVSPRATKPAETVDPVDNVAR
ncbi:MFS transporter [Curtobacterium sp. 20TX0008]|uniref:MFS transporter n=1 Tax=Curtobacterium sp. 20TX0008 TaxID=3022018 RepID=UPI00232E76E0|nr:MFS transporter [Curtobacterium sp. 20TX0008]MDB6427111.1 MFS transporter [Curtobacterium sp. 20TX0008]